MDPALIADYAVFFLSFVGIYAILSLGLNVQWGFTGLFNIGVAAFFSVGAYTSTILTTPENPNYLGGFELPVVVGFVAAMVTAGVLGFLVGIVTVRLRGDYLAIASIGIAEIVRLVLKNEDWLTNGVRGIPGIPRPFDGLAGRASEVLFMVIVVALLVLVYFALERARRAPWGRVLRGIREREPAVLAAGKNVVVFRLQAFVLGCMIMGLGGALYAHFFRFISPESFDPMYVTFLVWVMLIAGGSANNKGAILGPFVIWIIWSATEVLANQLPAQYVVQASAVRVLLVGVLLQVVLLTRPEGLLSEARQLERDRERESREERDR